MVVLTVGLNKSLLPIQSFFLGSTATLYSQAPLVLCPRLWKLSPSLRIEARNNTRTESAKIRNRRRQQKFTGSASKPRLSVFCSDKQLYAMLVDDKKKKTLFYASTLQKSICDDPSCTIADAAQRVGEELIKACKELNIVEISSYDRNGFARGERMMAFEIPIKEYGFLMR